jgi:hypothetical protein
LRHPQPVTLSGSQSLQNSFTAADVTATNVTIMWTQSGYSPTAMNVDFALITLKEDVDPAAGYLGMMVGQGSVTLDLTTAGYPGEKPQNSMWRGTCKDIKITYNANQPAFDNVVQCRDNVGPLLPLAMYAPKEQAFIDSAQSYAM